MKIEGLGEERRSTLFQIQMLVEEVDSLKKGQFMQMVDSYKTEDKYTHQVLTEAVLSADANYTRYLNNVLVGGKLGIRLMNLNDDSEGGTVLGKAMDELRKSITDEKEYRKQFLGPEIGKQIQVHEIQMRSFQKQEIKKQKIELKALAQAQRKGPGFFNFGI